MGSEIASVGERQRPVSKVSSSYLEPNSPKDPTQELKREHTTEMKSLQQKSVLRQQIGVQERLTSRKSKRRRPSQKRWTKKVSVNEEKSRLEITTGIQHRWVSADRRRVKSQSPNASGGVWVGWGKETST